LAPPPVIEEVEPVKESATKEIVNEEVPIEVNIIIKSIYN